MTERFEFTAGIKKALYILIGTGVIGAVILFFAYPENHHSRFWTSILINTYFFTGIGIFGIFFVAANTLAYSGWISVVKRIYLSFSGFIIAGAAFTALIVAGAFLGWHNLYEHWFDEHHRHALDSAKQIFLNPTFWVSRVIIYFLFWIFLGDRVVKALSSPTMNDPKEYKRSKLWSAAWILAFAVTESFVSWDLIMSTDPHWYSTLFGWYNFASYACAAFAFAILLVLFLKSKGYLAQVNENHIHDMGKYLFAFSIFWTYLWFSQFMLQWYGNIPEDTIYWVKRFDVPLFKVTIFLSLLLNFLLPLLVILQRKNKRNYKIVSTVAVLVIFGHYLDFFNMAAFEANVPATGHHAEHHAAVVESTEYTLLAEQHTENESTSVVSTDVHAEDVHAVKTTSHEVHGGHEAEMVKSYAGIGIWDLAVLAGFLGVFLYLFFNRLSKAPLVNESDPYLKESLKHHVEYA